MRRYIYLLLLTIVLSTASVSAQLNKYYYVFMGSELLSENRYREAIETLNMLLRYNPDAYEAYFLRGVAKFNLGDFLGAERDFTMTLEKNPVFTMAYQNRAITRSRLGNYEDALTDFDNAIELRPDLAGPYYSRGVTYLMNGEYRLALNDFDTFIRREDKVVEAYVNRGLAYVGLELTDSAMMDFDRALRLNPEFSDAYLHRGDLHFKEGDIETALSDYTKAIECDPNYILPYFKRAMLYYNEYKLPMKALDDIDRVIEIDPTVSIAYYNRALIRESIGDYNNALSDYNTVSRLSPGNVLVYFNRGGLNAFMGNLTDALNDYSTAIELYPDFANAYLMRARVKFFLHDEQGARRDDDIARRKIAEYRSMVTDSTAYAFSESSEFQQLLSFDSNLSRASFNKSSRSENGWITSLRPMYKFTMVEDRRISQDDPTNSAGRYFIPRLADFEKSLNDRLVVFSNEHTDINTDRLIEIEKELAEQAASDHDTEMLFRRAVAQTLIKQYTSAINTYTAAIEEDPANPFLYINRSATRVEMIDFISSIDMGRQRLTVDGDSSTRLNSGTTTRIYNYDDAIADLTKAARLYPDLAYVYYNRGNLYALSGMLPEAFDDYTRAIELNPYLADAYFNRGLVQIYLKDTRKGVLDIGKAGELGIMEAYDVLKYVSDF